MSELTKYTVYDLCRELRLRRECLGLQVWTNHDAELWADRKYGNDGPMRYLVVQKAMDSSRDSGVGSVTDQDRELFEEFMENCARQVSPVDSNAPVGKRNPADSLCSSRDGHKDGARRQPMKTETRQTLCEIADDAQKLVKKMKKYIVQSLVETASEGDYGTAGDMEYSGPGADLLLFNLGAAVAHLEKVARVLGAEDSPGQ